jgi:endonuclease III
MTNKDLPAVFNTLRRFYAQSADPYKAVTDKNPFRLLIGTIISLRTKSAVTAAASDRLFALAATVEKMDKLTTKQISKAIYPTGFYAQKAVTIKNICKVLLQQYNGKVPDNFEHLLALKGVGRKTANFVITTAFNKPGICVDVHVHRITNRWGYVNTNTPDKTELALREKLPLQYWIPINELLVLYGQQVCKPLQPLCNNCKLQRYCKQVNIA